MGWGTLSFPIRRGCGRSGVLLGHLFSSTQKSISVPVLPRSLSRQACSVDVTGAGSDSVE